MSTKRSFFPRRAAPALFACLLLTGSALAWAEALVYQREFSLMAGPDNVLVITLEADDRVVVERPGFMTRAGIHSARLEAGTHARMAARLDRIDIDSSRLADDLDQRSRNERVRVTDPEYSRFYALGEDRTVSRAITVESLEAWSDRFRDDPRLAQLRELELRWYELMSMAMTMAGERR